MTKKKDGHSVQGSVGARILEGLQEFTDALEKNKTITKQFTCRTIVLDLVPVRYSPAKVRATRKILRASQGLFAQFLGVSVKTVSAWEQGHNLPSDIACRFMDEIQRNPEFWRKRLRESVTFKRGDEANLGRVR